MAVTNAKLYVDRAEGFFGIGKSMKDAEFVCDCSDIDDVIVFTKDGRYIITKVSDKAFFDKNIYYIGVFKRNDERTIYNVLYRDGKNGPILMKSCAIKGITRDKEYDITKGTPRSEILYMTVNPNGEAEVLKVYFKPRPRLKKVIVDLDFSTLAIKGRQSQGNLFSRYGIHKIVMKERGTSTPRQPGNLVRRRRAPAQHRRAGLCTGRLQGRGQVAGMDAPHLLYHGLRPATALSRRYGAGRTLPSRAGLCGLLFRPRAELLLSETLPDRIERQDAVLPRRGGNGRFLSAARDVPERSWK